MDYEIKRSVNRNATEAAADAVTRAMEREGISPFEQTPEQRDRVRDLRAHFDAQYAEADTAESLLAKMTNQGREEAFIDLLALEHPYLLDRIAWTVLRAVATRIDRSDGYVDGRISPTLAEFATTYTRPLGR
jgi:hypothetical protein